MLKYVFSILIYRDKFKAVGLKNDIQKTATSHCICGFWYPSHLSENDVEETFMALLETEFYTENEEFLTEIVNYYEDTWIEQLDKKGRKRQPKFPIHIVSVC